MTQAQLENEASFQDHGFAKYLDSARKEPVEHKELSTACEVGAAR